MVDGKGFTEQWCFRSMLCIVVFLCSYVFFASSSDYNSLLALKSSIDPSSSLPWPRGGDVCRWKGVKACLKGRVSKLVVESIGLNGSLEGRSLNQLDQLRVLSFKANSLAGSVPDLSNLTNLKSLYLNANLLSGDFPASIATLHRLKVVVLSGNMISGEIPVSLVRLPRLYSLLLQDNQLTGAVPPLNQSSLTFFNVSDNQLSGEIPATAALLRFTSSSFSNNLDLCGELVSEKCTAAAPPPSPSNAPGEGETERTKKHHHGKKKLIIIIASSIAGLILLLIAGIVILCIIFKRKKTVRKKDKEVVTAATGAGALPAIAGAGEEEGKTGLAWEESGVGSLVFCAGAGEEKMVYTMEDLLRASAETLGRGTVGSTYKAVMESGFIVTVKRLRDVAGAAGGGRPEEFRRTAEILGRLRHPNLVPLRAYFQAKEERLLVYDYYPNGSLFSLIHGSKPTGRGKPLHWTSCLKIAEDLAGGLVYLHDTAGIVHGNLKSSNVLLGSDFESCLTDYGLHLFRPPDSADDAGSTGASSLFYLAPECRLERRSNLLTQQSDIYSFGVLLLELLTGKTPYQDLVQEHGEDIPKWVKTVREEETDSGEEPASSGAEASEEKMGALLAVAVACVAPAPVGRPAAREVVRLVREARGEVQVSSNSSEHSPGRWSDTVQGLPRELGSEHLSFTERD